MGPFKPVRRCVCANVTFERLHRLGVRSLPEAAQYGCGVTCGTCIPYLQRMVETGETAFEVIDGERKSA